MFTSFVIWWYGEGWLAAAKSLSARVRSLNESFSITALLMTLFQPWRRIISYPGASLNAKFHAALDNLFSRFVGFFVRLFVLLAAFVLIILVTILTIIEVLIWPLIPISWLIFIIMAVRS